MANIIGQLLVELGINTAAFKDGLDKSTYQAKQFGKELKEGFQEVGAGVGDLVREVGLLPPAFSGAAGSIINVLSSMGGAVHSVGGAFAGLAAVGAATGFAVIGVAIHAAEAAEKIYNLSQATGVSAQTLSGLSLVAGTVGVGIDQLAKGLEKMGKSAFAAASAAPTAANAYKTLGINVLDVNGHLRDQNALFVEISDKFSKLRDGGAKTALAIQLFGRAGAELIPILNLGGKEVEELRGHFEKLGAVMTDDIAAAGEKIHQNMEILGAAFTGVQNKILVGLAPALTTLTDSMVHGLEDGQSQINTFVAGLVDVAKVVINIFQIVAAVVGLIGDAFAFAGEEAYHLGTALGGVWANLKSGNVTGAWKAVSDGAAAAATGAEQSWKKAYGGITDTVNSIKGVWTATTPKATKPAGRDGDVDTKQVSLDFIEKMVQQMERQAAKEQELAKAVGIATNSQIDANAAAEAGLAIQKLVDEATQKGIQNTSKFKDALDAAIPRIQAAAQWQATFKAAVTDQGDFDKFTKKINEQVTAMEGEAAAGNSVEKQWAKNAATLQPLAEELKQINEKYQQLRAQYGDQNSSVQVLGDKVNSLATQYNAAADSVDKLNASFQQKAANDESKKLDEQIIKLRGDIDALKNGDTFLNVAAELDVFRSKIGLTDAQLAVLKSQLTEIRELQISKALGDKEKALGFDPQAIKTISEEISQLKTDWLAGKVGADAYSKTLAELVKEQADLEAKTGGFIGGAKAAFADLNASTQTVGETIHDEIGQGLKGISDNFSAMVATGKADWQGLVDSMEQALLKSAINNILSSLFSSIGGALSGQGGFLGSLGSMFGGGHAMGGDVTPGKAYIVGEKGPELFTPGYAGHITPNDSMPHGGGQQIVQNWNIQTPDADSFRRSQSQISSEMFRAAAQAHGRARS